MKFIETWNGQYINTEHVLKIRLEYSQVMISLLEYDDQIRLTDEKDFDENLLLYIVDIISESKNCVIRYTDLIERAEYRLKNSGPIDFMEPE